MLKSFIVVAAITSAAVTFAGPVAADDNGIAGAIHDLRREGRKLCQVDHWHYGNGSGATKKAALADAASSWGSFTAMEYGTDWGNFNKAASRAVSCTPSGGGVNCAIEGRPCR